MIIEKVKMDNIEILIYTSNNEIDIVSAIQSAKRLSKNIKLIDIGSIDKTIEKAKQNKINIIKLPYTSHVENVRKESIRYVKKDWVFVMDADEQISPELSLEIKSAISNSQYSHFKIPRKEFFGKNKWLKHGGWWPNYQVRLFRKDSLISWPKQIHSFPIFKGKEGVLENSLLHFSKGSLEKTVKKTIRFENIESDLLFKANRKSGTSTFFRKFFGELNRRLILNKGFLDGNIGIIESIYQAYSKTITYIFLYEKEKNSSL